MKRPAMCPRCGEQYVSEAPALSRWDNHTAVCPSCGLSEAIAQYMAQKMGYSDVGVRLTVDPLAGVRPWVNPPMTVAEFVNGLADNPESNIVHDFDEGVEDA